jgi:hypothetical protein
MAPFAALRTVAVATSLAALLFTTGQGKAQPQARPATPFAEQVAALSESEGYFDTDNLISNESSYLSVVPDIDRAAFKGGAYIGVGPDQNFSYIAAARPSIAFIIDVRRDNLLLQLLFKALFSLARTRVEYLSMLCGRPAPAELELWKGRTIQDLAAYVDGAPALDRAAVDAMRGRVTAKMQTFGVALSADDLQTVDRFHRRFIDSGLELRFQSLGRAPQLHYPTYKQLLVQDDGKGRQRNFLASEDAFQFVKGLQTKDLIVPVVGNLSGAGAMAAIGRWLREHNERLSVFYASNVEFYLFREGTFARFVDNLSRIPHGERALLVRSVFGGGGGYGGGSFSMTQSVPELLEGYAKGRYHEYWELTR